MNEKLVNALNKDAAAARAREAAEFDQAEKIYWSILKDPARTSEADQAALAEAVKTLGRSLDQVKAEASAIRAAHDMAAEAAKRHEAQAAVDQAEADLREYQTVTAPAMRKEIETGERQRAESLEARRADLASKLVNLYNLRKLRHTHPHLVDHLPAESSGGDAIKINGVVYDPDNLGSR